MKSRGRVLSFLFILAMLPSTRLWSASTMDLTLMQDPQTMALGMITPATCTPPWGCLNNPASLWSLDTATIALVHQWHWSGAGIDLCAIDFPLSSQQNLGFQFGYLNYGEIEQFSLASGFPVALENVHPFAFAFSSGYAHRISSTCILGVSLNLLQEQLATSSLYGLSGSSSVIWETPWQVQVGLTLSQLNLLPSSFDLASPSQMTLGLGWNWKQSLHLNAHYSYNLESTHWNELGIGLDFWFWESLALRAGYTSPLANTLTPGFVVGVGYKGQNWQLDYAYAPALQSTLPATHALSLSTHWQQTPTVPVHHFGH